MREKLIGLLENIDYVFDNDKHSMRDAIEFTAEYLLSKGVIVEKHGKWLKTNEDNKLRCSKCDVIHLVAQYPNGEINYCPNCGARMDGE